MYSLFAFLFTALEVGAAAAGYLLPSPAIFYNIVVYGSPFYLLQHAFGAGSLVYDSMLLYWGFLAFHLIKYFTIFQAQFKEESGAMRTLAQLLEAGYLALSAYYLL